MLKELQVRPHPEMQSAKYGCEHKKGSAKITEPAITILIASSIIQTLLSVSELHRIGRRSGSRTVTAGRELHPTPKILYFVSYDNCIATICQEQNRVWLLHYSAAVRAEFSGYLCAALGTSLRA